MKFSPSVQHEQTMVFWSTQLMYTLVDREHNSDGTVPLNAVLLYKSKEVSCNKFPNVDGIVPDNWLSLQSMWSITIKFPNVDGRGPRNWLLAKPK